MEIVCCPDKKYIMPCGVMIKSLCENNKDIEICIHIIVDNDVMNEDKESLIRVIKPYEKKSITFYDIDNIKTFEFPALNNNTHIKRATYFRLFMAEILPENIEKVLYLDGDIIIEKKLQYLWETNLDDHPIGCVKEQEFDNMTIYNRLHYSHSLGYFNAGVLLINLRYWREHRLSEKFVDFMVKYPERIVFHDQDILNYVLKENKIDLPFIYNVQSGFFYKKELQKIDLCKYGDAIEKAKKEPVIIHYSTGCKPWNEDCCHPLKNEFFKYQNMTEWKESPLVEKYIPNRPLRAIIGDILRLLKIKKPIKRFDSFKYFDC